MDRNFWNVIYQYLRMSLALFAGTGILAYLLFFEEMWVVMGAQFLSFLFVSSIFLVIRNFRKQSYKTFYRQFLIIFALRFLIMIAALVGSLELLKFHHIHFTVSFIISYILHSIIEIFLINQILQTDN